MTEKNFTVHLRPAEVDILLKGLKALDLKYFDKGLEGVKKSGLMKGISLQKYNDLTDQAWEMEYRLKHRGRRSPKQLYQGNNGGFNTIDNM